MERKATVDETGGAVLAAWPNVSASTPLFHSLVETVKEARRQHARDDDGRWSDRLLEDLLSHARGQLRSDTTQVPLGQALLQPKKVGQKDAHAAESWKEQGNRLFASKQWREAIRCYTEAVRYAPPLQPSSSSSSASSSTDSTAASTEPIKAYACANRGMALYQLKEYESAVLDLTAALDERHGYPQQRRWKLLHKRGCCWYQQKKVEEALVDFKAAEASLLQPSPASEEAAMKQIRRSLQQAESMLKRKGVPLGENKSKQTKEQHKKEDKRNKFVRAMAGNISDAVQVSYEEHKGRFVRSGRGIDVGEDIVREEAYAAVLLRHYELHRCHHCLRPLPLASTPCDECAQVLFCSLQCKQESRIYHDVECGYLMFTAMPTLLLLSVRTVLRGLCEFLSQQGDEADNHHQYLSQVRSKTESQLLFGKDEPTEESVWQGGYLSLYSLLTHSNCLPAETLAQHVLDTALFDLLLYRLLPFLHLPPFLTLSTVQHISGLVLHHLCQTQTNVYAIFDVVEEQQEAALREPPNPISAERGIIIPHIKTTQVRVAEAFFPTASLFNHSCVPNTFLRYHGRTIVIRASRAITAGEEISNCYGPHAIHMPDHKQRQRLLREQYFFDCDCTACSPSLLPSSTVLSNRQLICPTESCNKLSIPLVVATPEAINKDNNRDTKEEQKLDAQKVLRCSKCNAIFSIDKAKQELELASTFFEQGVRHWNDALALAEGATNNYNQQAAIQKQQNAAVKCLCHCLKLRTKWLSSEQSMEVAKTHDKLAEVYSGLARWKEAAMHCRSGTLIVGQLFGRFSAEMGRECFKLCQLLFNGMQMQEALSAVEDTIAIFKVLVGEDRVDVGGKGDQEEMREELQQMRKYLLDAMTQRHHHPA
ncbi:SET and MYND domain-containing protein 4 [Balamuthia mandrillaris]